MHTRARAHAHAHDTVYRVPGGFRLLALTVDQQEVVLWILLEAESVWVWWEADELVRGR